MSFGIAEPESVVIFLPTSQRFGIKVNYHYFDIVTSAIERILYFKIEIYNI